MNFQTHFCRYASCLGSDKSHCDGGNISPPTSPPTPPASSSAATFLGIGLDATDVEVALNVQFALLIVLFAFSLVITCLMFKKKIRIDSSEEKYQYAL